MCVSVCYCVAVLRGHHYIYTLYHRASVEPASRPPRHEYPDRGDRRTNERFPDNHQVFVGNLPQDIADLQLKRFFTGKKQV